MAYTEEEWHAKALELADLYQADHQLAAGHFRNHRHFMEVRGHEMHLVSVHTVMHGLRGGKMGKGSRSGQNLKKMLPDLEEAGFVQIREGDPGFNEVWQDYVELGRRVGSKGPSGGPKKPPRERSFLVLDAPGAQSCAPDDIPEAFEGATTQVTTNRYERDPRLRRKCIEHFMQMDDGRLACQVCGMDFISTYGEIGAGFIHIHHCDPLADGKGERPVDPVRDLVPVCPNCHAMLHRKPGRTQVHSVEELIAIRERQARFHAT